MNAVLTSQKCLRRSAHCRNMAVYVSPLPVEFNHRTWAQSAKRASSSTRAVTALIHNPAPQASFPSLLSASNTLAASNFPLPMLKMHMPSERRALTSFANCMTPSGSPLFRFKTMMLSASSCLQVPSDFWRAAQAT